MKLYIWEGSGISEAYHDDGTLVVLAESPEQAREVARASAEKPYDSENGALWHDGLGYASDYHSKNVPNPAIEREPDRVVELTEACVVAFNGGGYD